MNDQIRLESKRGKIGFYVGSKRRDEREEWKGERGHAKIILLFHYIVLQKPNALIFHFPIFILKLNFSLSLSRNIIQGRIYPVVARSSALG